MAWGQGYLNWYCQWSKSACRHAILLLIVDQKTFHFDHRIGQAPSHTGLCVPSMHNNGTSYFHLVKIPTPDAIYHITSTVHWCLSYTVKCTGHMLNFKYPHLLGFKLHGWLVNLCMSHCSYSPGSFSTTPEQRCERDQATIPVLSIATMQVASYPGCRGGEYRFFLPMQPGYKRSDHASRGAKSSSRSSFWQYTKTEG